MANDSVVETTQNWPAYQGTVTGCDTPGLWALFLGTFVTCHTTNGGPPAAMENTFDVCQKDSLSLVYHYRSCARYIVPLSRRLYIFAGYVTTLHLFACPSSIARRSCVWRRLRRRKWPAAWLKTEPSCADCNSMNGSYIMNHKEDSNTTILEKKKTLVKMFAPKQSTAWMSWPAIMGMGHHEKRWLSSFHPKPKITLPRSRRSSQSHTKHNGDVYQQISFTPAVVSP